MNTLLILNGIPGSGKSTLGELLRERNGYNFVKIDTFYETLPRVNEEVEWFDDLEYKENVYAAFENAIKNAVIKGHVIIESTGIGKHYSEIIERLKGEEIEMVKIFLDINIDIARERVEIRNATDYLIKVTPRDMDYFIDNKHKIDLADTLIVDANRELEHIYLDVCEKLKGY